MREHRPAELDTGAGYAGRSKTRSSLGLTSAGSNRPVVLQDLHLHHVELDCRHLQGDVCLAYVRQFLAPALLLGDVVVLDNLSARKVIGAQHTIAAVCASILCLPPYSPDLNPDRADVRQAEGAHS
ncbi:MAG: transposase [Janthinobacterium lividum]